MTDQIPREEELFRQVNPGCIKEGEVKSSAFNPSKDHDFKLSMDRGSKTTAEEAFEHFNKKLKSVRVLRVHAKDFEEVKKTGGHGGEQVLEACAVVDDPNPESAPDNDAHCYADFGSLGSRGKKKHRAKLLLDRATRAYEPPD